jgi:hypothetical protein
MSAHDKDVKSLLLAGIIAAGVFAGAFGSMQLLSASAQTTDDGSQPPVTSIDDIDCTTDPSVVHCVDDPMPVDLGCETGAEFCEATVSTSGTATSNVKPDKVTVTVGVENSGATAEEAASQNADSVAAVIAALKELGIDESQMSTSQYSVYPVYSYTDLVNACRVMEGFPVPPECYVESEITGYKASSSISVTLDVEGDVSAEQAIDAAVGAGANTVSGAYFFVSPEMQEQVQQGLIEEAIANARHRADIAAGAVGMHVSGVKSVSLNDAFFPPFYVRDAAAISSAQILPGEQQVSMTVQMIFRMSGGVQEGEESDGGIAAVAIAREFILSKLPELGIEIDDELDLHTDMVAQISESEYHLEFGVMDTEGQSHDGHIEIVDGEVTVALLDGESIL